METTEQPTPRDLMKELRESFDAAKLKHDPAPEQMQTFRVRAIADSRSNRRDRTYTVQAANAEDALFEVRIRHSIVVGGNSGVYVEILP